MQVTNIPRVVQEEDTLLWEKIVDQILLQGTRVSSDIIELTARLEFKLVRYIPTKEYDPAVYRDDDTIAEEVIQRLKAAIASWASK